MGLVFSPLGHGDFSIFIIRHVMLRDDGAGNRKKPRRAGGGPGERGGLNIFIEIASLSIY